MRTFTISSKPINKIYNLGVQALAALNSYTSREALKPLFERKTLFVYNLFKQEVQDAKQDLIDEKEERPALLPYFSGRAMMANMKKNRLNMLYKILKDAAWMLPCSLAEEIILQYNKLIASIDELITNLYRKWIDVIGDDVHSRLKRPLMRRSAEKAGLFECNIDGFLLDMIHEAKYWQLMHFDIPGHVMNLYNKASSIKFVYDSVIMVVMDYNKILAALSDEERLLFRVLIQVVERKIAPGLSKLTWATEVSDAYIAECSSYTAEVKSL